MQKTASPAHRPRHRLPFAVNRAVPSGWLAAFLCAAAAHASPALVVVRGAAGEPAFAEPFKLQAQKWEEAGRRMGAAIASPETREALRARLTSEPDSAEELWIVLIGHGTFDGKSARFNLTGDDVSADDLAEWLQGSKRPLVLIDVSAASAPFMARLAGPNRIVITATRSGSEHNYARLGEHLAPALGDPASDLDADGSISLLEAFLTAAARTTEFYKAEGRLLTEHALIDDNGDGVGTPAEWFRGLRALKKPAQADAIDGARARQFTLAPSEQEKALSPAQRQRRDAIERRIAALREEKATMKEDDYYARLEPMLRELAAVYRAAPPPDATAPAPPAGQPPAIVPQPAQPRVEPR